MFRQVNAQHPSRLGGKRRKCCGFRFITALAMHEQPDIGAGLLYSTAGIVPIL